MKNKKILILIVSTVLLAASCLEGMNKKPCNESGLVGEAITYDPKEKKKFFESCKKEAGLFYRICFLAGTTADDVNEVIEKFRWFDLHDDIKITGIDLHADGAVNPKEVNWCFLDDLRYLSVYNRSSSKKVFNGIYTLPLKMIIHGEKLYKIFSDMGLFEPKDDEACIKVAGNLLEILVGCKKLEEVRLFEGKIKFTKEELDALRNDKLDLLKNKARELELLSNLE